MHRSNENDNDLRRPSKLLYESDLPCDFDRFHPKVCNRAIIDNPHCTLCNACNISYMLPVEKRSCSTKSNATPKLSKNHGKKSVEGESKPNCHRKKIALGDKNICRSSKSKHIGHDGVDSNQPSSSSEYSKATVRDDSKTGECVKFYFLCGKCPGEENLWFKPIHSENLPQILSSDQALYKIKRKRKKLNENSLDKQYPSKIRIFMPVDLQRVSTATRQSCPQKKEPSIKKRNNTLENEHKQCIGKGGRIEEDTLYKSGANTSSDFNSKINKNVKKELLDMKLRKEKKIETSVSRQLDLNKDANEKNVKNSSLPKAVAITNLAEDKNFKRELSSVTENGGYFKDNGEDWRASTITTITNYSNI